MKVFRNKDLARFFAQTLPKREVSATLDEPLTASRTIIKEQPDKNPTASRLLGDGHTS